MYSRLQSLLPARRKRSKAIGELASADPRVRANAALRLGELKHPAAIAPLVPCLDDPDELVREQAARALAEIGPAAGPLVAKSLADAAPPLRVRLFDVLGRIRSGEGAAAAVTALSDPDPGVRTAAAEALRRIAEPKPDSPREDAGASAAAVDESAAADLILGLRDPDSQVRLESAQALAEMRHRPAASALLAVLRDGEEDKDIRGNAALALGRIGEERAVKHILPMLDDEELEGFAAEALYAMSGGLDEMVQRLQASPPRRGGSGEHPRARIVRALGAVGSPKSIGSLFRAAADPDPGVRTAAVRALNAVIGEMQHQRSVEPAEYARLRTAVTGVLKMLLSDADARVRLAALEAQNDPPGRELLLALAADPDPKVRQHACAGLGLLGVREVFDTLAAARTDEDEFVRCSALDGLGRFDDGSVVPLLIASLDDPALRVRLSAAQALSRENAPWASRQLPVIRDALVRGLGDESVEVRAGSVRAFGRLRDAGAVDALIAVLGDPDPIVRDQVARALGDIGQERALPALRALASDPHPSVRGAAATATKILDPSAR